MSDSQDAITQDNLKLIESINRRLDSIYNQLSEYEEALDPSALDDCGDSQCKILDILETLDQIQDAAQIARPYNIELRSMQRELEEQMKCLGLSMDMLKLETGKKFDTAGGDSGSMDVG